MAIAMLISGCLVLFGSDDCRFEADMGVFPLWAGHRATTFSAHKMILKELQVLSFQERDVKIVSEDE